MANLLFKFGPMGCGKTRDLMREWYNYNENDKKAIIIKPEIDTKGDNTILSRDGSQKTVDKIIEKKDNIYRYITKYILDNRLDCILVDEAQFLSRKHVEQLRDVVDILNIDVICYGLRVDFLNKLFPGSDALFALSDQLQELTLKCKCLNKATANVRFVNGKPCFKGKQVAIDGEDKVTYVSMCNKCRRDLLRK